MATQKPPRLRVFVDSDVLFAGAASPNEHSASNLILRMAELTLIEGVISEQVLVEVERNLQNKLPKALPAFQLLVRRSLTVVPDPQSTDLSKYIGLAASEDLPILVASIREKCDLLTTFNIRHYQPGHTAIVVLTPGDLVSRVRFLLARLTHDR